MDLISLPVEPDALHAVMRVTLRLTREHQFALMFAELGGPKLLLDPTQASGFQGFTSLATLLFRHILEEPNTLKHTLEKVGGGGHLEYTSKLYCCFYLKCLL